MVGGQTFSLFRVGKIKVSTTGRDLHVHTKVSSLKLLGELSSSQSIGDPTVLQRGLGMARCQWLLSLLSKGQKRIPPRSFAHQYHGIQ